MKEYTGGYHWRTNYSSSRIVEDHVLGLNIWEQTAHGDRGTRFVVKRDIVTVAAFRTRLEAEAFIEGIYWTIRQGGV